MTSPNSVTLRESEERAPKQGATAKFGVVIDGGGGIWEIDGSKKLSQLTANGGCGAKALDTMPAWRRHSFSHSKPPRRPRASLRENLRAAAAPAALFVCASFEEAHRSFVGEPSPSEGSHFLRMTRVGEWVCDG